MELFVNFVLDAAVSLRGSAAVLAHVSRWLPEPMQTPTAACGQEWLLRLGLHALERPKTQADDWAWIVDHTIQLGPLKVLIVVGVRLSTWARGRGPLEHHDLEVLLLEPVTQSTGEVVEEQLLRVTEKTGVPRMILSDQGTDLKRGIERFRVHHPQTAWLSDVKHHAARVVKQELNGNARWNAFLHAMNHTKTLIRQTSLAHLMPPQPREKARFMNADKFVTWGRDTLDVLEREAAAATPRADLARLEEKLAWLRGFREDLRQWTALFEVVAVAIDHVREDGYHRHAADQLRTKLSSFQDGPARQAADKLVAFVEEQSAHAREREHLLGSSEVLESLIGKQKRLHGQHSRGGFTKMLLAAAAAVVRPTTATIKTAMQQVKTKDVRRWTKQHLGDSLVSQRRLAYTAVGTKMG
jgi:hypothetical protein